MLNVNYDNGSVTVPGSHGRHFQTAFEDVCSAIAEDCFAQTIREANGVLDRHIYYEINDAIVDSDADDQIVSDATDTTCNGTDHTTADNLPAANCFDPSICSDDQPDTFASAAQVHNASAEPELKPSTCDKIEVYWPPDNEYYPGVTAEEQNGDQTIVYDDGSIKTLDFSSQTWCFASSATLLSIYASSIRLESNTPQILAVKLQYFENEPFLRHQAQAFPEY